MKDTNFIFEINNLSFAYPEQDRKALDGINLKLPEAQFVTLFGPSGCGKSTLLRQLKSVLAPHGLREGSIYFCGEPIESVDMAIQSACIGFVQQSAENQIVTDKVWHELAFGLESLGMKTEQIRARVAEMAAFFGIENWFYKDVRELSGGQKQLLNLASIMAMHPSVLILDEPTGQLDPIAASEFLAVIGKINRELGTTVIIVEHRLEEVFPFTDRVIVMDCGRIIADGSVQDVGEELRKSANPMFLAMPAPMRIWAATDDEGACPVSVRDGRNWLERFSRERGLGGIPEERVAVRGEEKVLSMHELWFKYEKDSPDVLRGLSLEVFKGEFLAILGGNGTGKTTALSVIAGLRKPYRGELSLSGTVAMLPQDPQSLFVKKNVREDLFEMFRGSKVAADIQEAKVAGVVHLCRLEELLKRHPYDLSGGEQQRLALAKVLLLNPDILLLDEPTKGFDAEFKQTLAAIIRNLQRSGVTVIMVSHDVEFCAEHADRCALFFDGSIVTEGRPRSFFSGNSFYTSSANRMARKLLPEAVTAEDVIYACGGKLPETPEIPDLREVLPQEGGKGANLKNVYEEDGDAKSEKLPLWRKAVAALAAAVALFSFVKAIGVTDLTQLVGSGGLTKLSDDYVKIYGLLISALVIFALATARKSRKPELAIQLPREKRKLPLRTAVAAGLILLLVPLTIFFGHYYLGDRKYYFISLAVLFKTMIPFALVFEGRKPKARELVVIAVLCALGVAGRAAFFMLPNFKPVMAIVIVAGVALGGESGFLVGAMTMLASNVMFGQGPWTPYQMFAMGLIGFLAGVFFRKGLLRRTRASLCIFGAICAVVVYGGLMNPAAALMWTNKLNKEILITYYITGFPVDCIHAAATVLTLWFAGLPMLEKLDRVKVKYGLVE